MMSVKAKTIVCYRGVPLDINIDIKDNGLVFQLVDYPNVITKLVPFSDMHFLDCCSAIYTAIEEAGIADEIMGECDD